MEPISLKLALGSARLVLTVLVTLLALLPPVSRANHDAKRLYDDLLRKNNYNKLIRPSRNSTDGLTVRLGLRLAQLIDVVSGRLFVIESNTLLVIVQGLPCPRT